MTAARSDALVLFGVTGDLAHKMIFPALYAMTKRGALTVPVIGVTLPKWSAEDLHKRVTDSIKKAGGIDDRRAFGHLLSRLGYVSGGDLSEDFGVENRGAFYETAGCLRDVVQNHLFRIVALLAMEPPAGRDFGAVHNEKAKVFQAMRPLAPVRRRPAGTLSARRAAGRGDALRAAVGRRDGRRRRALHARGCSGSRLGGGRSRS